MYANPQQSCEDNKHQCQILATRECKEIQASIENPYLRVVNIEESNQNWKEWRGHAIVADSVTVCVQHEEGEECTRKADAELAQE